MEHVAGLARPICQVQGKGDPGGGARRPCTDLLVEVTNLSSFAITVEEVGLTVGKPGGSLPRRAMIPPHSIINGTLPMRIEPRHSGSVVGWAQELPNDGYDYAYARTSGGEIGYGTSPHCFNGCDP